MRLVLDTLRECPILSHAADKAGIHRKTLKYWMERSEAGDDSYDVEWQSLTWRFHEHCKSAIDEAHDQLLAVVLQIANGEIFKTDPFLVNVLGYQGVDAYAQDENGNFIVEAVGRPNFKMMRFFLELVRPEEYGKNRKTDIPQRGGVIVLGESTQKLENNSAATIKVRKWKSCSRKIRQATA